jgi:hypothetical protein
MKIGKHELQKLIREEFMQGVPEFMLRQAADDCVESVRQHIKKFIQLRAQNPTHMREMLSTSNEILSELDDELYQLLETKLFSFIQRT